MVMDAVSQIVANNQRRHANNTNQLRCTCGLFVSEDCISRTSTDELWICERCGPCRRFVKPEGAMGRAGSD